MLFPSINIFVDVGGNNRYFLEGYLKTLPPFQKIYVFEPNPLFHEDYKNSNLILIKKAAWISYCKLPFYLSKDDRQVGSSLLQDKLCRVGTEFKPNFDPKPIEVECVDFSNWIKTTMKPHYNLTVKLDIEGSEYEVLWKMIQDGTISYIKKLFVEFHKEHLGLEQEKHLQLIHALQAINLPPNHWD